MDVIAGQGTIRLEKFWISWMMWTRSWCRWAAAEAIQRRGLCDQAAQAGMQIYGVQAAGAPSMYESVKAMKDFGNGGRFADGIASQSAGQ